MRRIHIIGRKNSGKTTLIVELVQQLSALGLRVATIKHTHHRHELDVPGKDSYRHREAGAAAVGILSPAMNAVFWPASRDDGPHAHQDRYHVFAALFADCDIVLVEGDSRTTALKVEVWREETATPPMASEDPSIHALVTDSVIDLPLPTWPRRDVEGLARRIVDLARGDGP